MVAREGELAAVQHELAGVEAYLASTIREVGQLTDAIDNSRVLLRPSITPGEEEERALDAEVDARALRAAKAARATQVRALVRIR